MTPDPVTRLRQRFRLILDPDAREHQHVETVADSCLLPELDRRLKAVFRRDPQVQAILIRHAYADVGIATRATAGEDRGHAGVTADSVDPGSGDGATLPGLPGEFRPVRYRCTAPGCPASATVTYYDERREILCPAAGHGLMEYAP